MLKNIRKSRFKLFSLYKSMLQSASAGATTGKQVVFIIGCQRSGTSLMSEIFDLDLRTKIYGEVSELSRPDDSKRLRLLPIDQVQGIIKRQNAGIVIMKPLVESQNIIGLLEAFPCSKALWMYRHYLDVISSGLIMFGEDVGFRDLQPMLEMDKSNWRGEGVTEETRRMIEAHYSPSMTSEEAVALFWFARNRLFFDLNLAQKSTVLLCRYEDLVQNSLLVMRRIYSFLNIDFPGKRICKNIHSRSVKKGAKVVLSKEIESLCEELYQRLNREYVAAVSRIEPSFPGTC